MNAFKVDSLNYPTLPPYKRMTIACDFIALMHPIRKKTTTKEQILKQHTIFFKNQVTSK